MTTCLLLPKCFFQSILSTLPLVDLPPQQYFSCRAGQRCFGLLALISRPHVRPIHLPERMTLPESLIPSDKYILKNLTFVVFNLYGVQ